MRIDRVVLYIIFGLMPLPISAQKEHKSIRKYPYHQKVPELMHKNKQTVGVGREKDSVKILPGMKSKGFSSPHQDSIAPSKEIWTNRDRENASAQGLAEQQNARFKTHGENYFQGGRFATFGNLGFYGSLSKEEYRNLLTTNSLRMGTSYTMGNLSLQAEGVVNRYMTFGVLNQYGVAGQMGYVFSPNMSLTLFGEYYNKTPYFSMAAYPYVYGSQYGGYFTFNSGRVGMKLGAERYYDPFALGWETKPIVTPAFHVSKNFTIELPAGDLVKQAAEKYIWKRK